MREREARRGEARQGTLRKSAELPTGTHRSSKPGRDVWQIQGQQGGQARAASEAPFSWVPFPGRMPWGASLSPFMSVLPWELRSKESEAWDLLSAPHSNLPASLRTVPGAEAVPSWGGMGSGGRGVQGDPEGLGGGTGQQEVGSGETERPDTGLGVLDRESREVWESKLALEAEGGRRAGGLRDAVGGSQKMGVHMEAGTSLEVRGSACGEEPLCGGPGEWADRWREGGRGRMIRGGFSVGGVAAGRDWADIFR